jgi:hypothetical protein
MRDKKPSRQGRSRRGPKGVAPEIDMQILDLERPSAPKGVFHARAGRPTDHVCGLTTAAGSRAAVGHAFIAEGCASGSVEKPTIPSKSKPPTQRIEPRLFRLKRNKGIERRHPIGGPAVVGPGDIVFDAQNPVAHLKAAADGAAEQTARQFDAMCFSETDSLGTGLVFVIKLAVAPVAAAFETKIAAGPVVRRRGVRGANRRHGQKRDAYNQLYFHQTPNGRPSRIAERVAQIQYTYL